MAIRAMISNRMRTLLTMLGIIIGIMSVVTVVALARGASDQIISNISSMGTNTITIMPGQKMGDMRSGRVRTLSVKDLKALKGQPFVDSASPTVQNSGMVQRYNVDATATVIGVSGEYFRVYGMEIERAECFLKTKPHYLLRLVLLITTLKTPFSKMKILSVKDCLCRASLLL